MPRLNVWAAINAHLAVSGLIMAASVDDFESYSTGVFNPPGWSIVDSVTSGSPTIHSNAQNTSGKHLQFNSTWSPNAFDTIAMTLPNALTSDGDYLQLAVNVRSGTAMASLMMQPGPFLPNPSEPWAAIGLDTQFHQFNHGYNSVHVSGNRFGSAATNQWYYLRATMRDSGGQAGEIDSYDFQAFSDPAGMNLISQKTGIPFRNGYEGFISDIALRSFEQLDQTATVLFDQISTNKTSSNPVPRPVDMGSRWVRNNPFNIFGRAGMDATDPLLQQIDFTGIEARQGSHAESAVTQGLTWNGHFSEALYAGTGSQGPLPLTTSLKAAIADFVVQGGMNGVFQLDDEPAVEVMDDLGVIADWIRETYPRHPILVTAGWGPTEEYVDTLMTTVRPDILMYDIYPVLRNRAFDRDYHFEYLSLIRNKGLEYNVPTYAWLQSFSDSVRRLPSESELRMLAYTYLAAGYKGLGYYRYLSNATETGLIDANGQPGPLFSHAANLNLEIQHLGTSLRFLESTDIRYVPGFFANAPDGLATWASGSGGDTHLVSMRVQSSVLGRDGMIGTFTDNAGDIYFMLVNLFQGANRTAAQANLEFVLTFDADTDVLYRLNRLSGVPERVILYDHVLSLMLPGGTGDLFKYENGFFPGITPGDSDLDGDVDLSDLSVLAAAYGTSGSGIWTTGDFDLDGDVDLADLSLLATYYGAGTAEAFADFQQLSSIPEPSSAACILLISSLGLRRAGRN